MNAPRSKKQAWVEDVHFVFEECVRVHALISNALPGRLNELPRSDLAGDLPHPSGWGNIPCSATAIRRVRNLAEQALLNSDAAETLEPERVYRVFRGIIVFEGAVANRRTQRGKGDGDGGENRKA